MNEFTLVSAFSELQKDIKDSELSKNEKLFLLSAGFGFHSLISSNEISFYKYRYNSENYKNINSYFDNNISNLIEIYRILGEKISITNILGDIVNKKIKEFNYIKDVLKIFYRDYLLEDEKSHVIKILNEVPKRFLQNAMNIGGVNTNINSLMDFFKLAYHITDKNFRYNEKVAYDILETNKYERNKVFFNTLKNVLNERNHFGRKDETTLAFIDNIENLLNKVSEDFNVSMAKSLLK